MHNVYNNGCIISINNRSTLNKIANISYKSLNMFIEEIKQVSNQQNTEDNSCYPMYY